MTATSSGVGFESGVSIRSSRFSRCLPRFDRAFKQTLVGTVFTKRVSFLHHPEGFPEHLVHQIWLQAENDDLGMIEGRHEADAVAEPGSFVIFGNANAVPPVPLDIRDHLPFTLVHSW